MHNHFRPGGVRRLVELAAPQLVHGLRSRPDAVALVSGELPERTWLDRFVASVSPVSVSCHVEPALRYFAEQRQNARQISQRLHRFLEPLLATPSSAKPVVWAHNQGLGRNLLLTRELRRLCARHQVPLILHHHDWWFDNRWHRWPELRRSGFSTLAQVARTVFPAESNVRAVAVNEADTAILKRHFYRAAAWWPNPAEERPATSAKRVNQARHWFRQQVGQSAPVWLMPCRLVRRKNIAEGLLLTRWLRPEAWLLTTGNPSSRDEEPYGRRLREAARKHGWKLLLGILSGAESTKPSVPRLIAASEAVLLTSVQEGFGFTYIEAAAARRPLLARSLTNMAPDLRKFGFRFPQTYDEILIAPSLFDWGTECRRQRALFERWLGQLPRSCRRYVSRYTLPVAAAVPRPVAFSRLTLSAQLEVLAWPATESFALCSPLNPMLATWRERAAVGKLLVTTWPTSASKWLCGLAYARRFSNLLKSMPAQSQTTAAPLRAQEDFLRARLDPRNLYPILWSTHT